MSNLHFAIVGAGFWARFQLAAWRELAGVECVALCDRDPSKAEALSRSLAVPAVYTDAAAMVRQERLDFLDVITDVNTHGALVQLAAAHALPVICQKPMAATLADARRMVEECQAARVPFFVHENWRWQTPLRAVKRVLESRIIGAPFRARLQFCSSFPVFDNQPFLKDLTQFILTDMGSHILDVVRFLFGEVQSVYCQTHRIHRDIQGEDVATVMLQMQNGMTVVCEISYASRTEYERFPETYVFIEGEVGSLELGPDYWVRCTTADGTHAKRYPPPRYDWADPAYDLVQASMVPCQANLLAALQGTAAAETTAADNLQTMELVFSCYESAARGAVLHLQNERNV